MSIQPLPGASTPIVPTPIRPHFPMRVPILPPPLLQLPVAPLPIPPVFFSLDPPSVINAPPKPISDIQLISSDSEKKSSLKRKQITYVKPKKRSKNAPSGFDPMAWNALEQMIDKLTKKQSLEDFGTNLDGAIEASHFLEPKKETGKYVGNFLARLQMAKLTHEIAMAILNNMDPTASINAAKNFFDNGEYFSKGKAQKIKNLYAKGVDLSSIFNKAESVQKDENWRQTMLKTMQETLFSPNRGLTIGLQLSFTYLSREPSSVEPSFDLNEEVTQRSMPFKTLIKACMELKSSQAIQEAIAAIDQNTSFFTGGQNPEKNKIRFEVIKKIAQFAIAFLNRDESAERQAFKEAEDYSLSKVTIGKKQIVVKSLLKSTHVPLETFFSSMKPYFSEQGNRDVLRNKIPQCIHELFNLRNGLQKTLNTYFASFSYNKRLLPI